jgi:hypothetical protein
MEDRIIPKHILREKIGIKSIGSSICSYNSEFLKGQDTITKRRDAYHADISLPNIKLLKNDKKKVYVVGGSAAYGVILENQSTFVNLANARLNNHQLVK